MNTKHLKAKILDLAIRGKLVPQDPSEGNAADLLKKIREEKNIFIEQKKIKADKNSSFIIKAEDGRHYEQFADGSLIDIEDDIPFEIPENWCWCRLYNLASISTGSTPLKSNKKYYENGNIPFVTSADTSKKMVSKVQSFITQLALEENHLTLNPVGSLIVAMYGEGKTRGQITELAISAATNQACAVIQIQNETIVSRAFIKNFFLYNYDNIRREAKGGNQANLNLTNIGNIFIPLPPLSEQKRIVSAIEKAFEQIDIIEKNKLNLKIYIKQTKSKVLDLAIRGKLVEQIPQEGNPADLLQKIRDEKAELIKQKKLKEDKKSSFIIKSEDGKYYEQFADGTLIDIEEEIPCAIPENWSWCRLGTVISIKSGDFVKVVDNQEGEYPIYGGNGINGYNSNYNINKKTIIIGRVGFYCGSIHLTKGKAWITDNAFITDFDSRIFDINYLYHLLGKLDLRSKSNSTAQPVVSGRSIYPILFPLPPLAEQKRIIDRIEQIFEQLDILEKSLGE